MSEAEQNLATAITTMTSLITGKIDDLIKSIENLAAAIKASKQG